MLMTSSTRFWLTTENLALLILENTKLTAMPFSLNILGYDFVNIALPRATIWTLTVGKCDDLNQLRRYEMLTWEYCRQPLGIQILLALCY